MNLFVLPALSALLLILSFPNFNLNFLSWFFLVPVLAAVKQDNGLLKPKASVVSGAIPGYVFGAAFFLGSIYWISHVSFAGYVGLSLYLALYFCAFVYLMEKFIRQGRSIIFWAPAVWVALEFARSKIITGFPWALAGATQIPYLYLVQIASVTGVWGVSFIVVMINAFVFENLYLGVFRKEGVRSYHATVMAVVLLGFVAFRGMQELKDSEKAIETFPFKVSVVQPNIPQEQKWDARFRNIIFGRFRYLTSELKKEQTDLIIWPESCVPGEMKYDREIYDFVTGLSRQTNSSILFGSQDVELAPERKFYNAAILYHPKYKMIGQYNKLHLVPFGEYVPLAGYFPFMRKLTPIEADFSPGKEPSVFGVPQITLVSKENDGSIRSFTRIVRFGVGICFEDTFPDVMRRFAKRDLDFLVNITNDAWFKDTPAPFQHANLSAFRAIENRLYLVRGTNTGYSCVIDPYGRFVADLRDKDGRTTFVPGHFTYEIKSLRKRTIYTHFGDYFPVVCVVISLIGIALVYLRSRNTGGKNV